ncbi:MAG TPA: DEAD/DEAH box helicase, partial [Gemmatimonadaceae bacterium]
LLTGTPIRKNAGDFFPLLRLCNRREFTSYWRFVQEYCYTKETPWATEIGDVRDPAAFQRLLEPYVSHCALTDVFTDIPDAIWTTIPVLMTPKETLDHKKIKKEYRSPSGEPLSGAGAVVPELRRLTAAGKNKIEATKQLLADHDDEKVIVWTWYKESAQVVAECCVANDRQRFLATGDLTPLRRADVIRQWLDTEDGVLVATLASVGEGYNLQDSRVAVFYEMDYLPSTNLQALARQRRHGQTDTVRAYAVVAKGSIDTAIAKIAQRRDTSNSTAQGLEAVLTELMKNA